MIKKFNIRVYGLLIQKDHLLVVDEILQTGQEVTKFPGGGLEFGEGPKDCLEREFLEETGMEVKVTEHFYTTDYFQQSWAKSEDQIISIYYKVKTVEPIDNLDFKVPFEQHQDTETILGFRWVKLSDLKYESVTLPIDQRVVEILLI